MIVICNKSTSIRVVQNYTHLHRKSSDNSLLSHLNLDKYTLASGKYNIEGVKCRIALAYLSAGSYFSEGYWTMEPGNNIVPKLRYDVSKSYLYICVKPCRQEVISSSGYDIGDFDLQKRRISSGMMVQCTSTLSYKLYYGSTEIDKNTFDFEISNNDSFIISDAKKSSRKGFWGNLSEELFSGKCYADFYQVSWREDIPLSIEWTENVTVTEGPHYHPRGIH